MIKGKNPNFEQKKLLQNKAKVDPTDWLLIKNNKDSYVFRNKKDENKVIELPK